MPKGTKKTVVERLTTITLINDGFTLEEVSAILVKDGYEPMNENSYKSERDKYAPAVFDSANPYTLREHINSPRTWGEF
jgi:hypothetical protein